MTHAAGKPRYVKDIISIEEIEEYLIFFADLVDEIGPIAQPLLDRMEREYEIAKRGKQGDRIRRLIQSRHHPVQRFCQTCPFEKQN